MNKPIGLTKPAGKLLSFDSFPVGFSSVFVIAHSTNAQQHSVQDLKKTNELPKLDINDAIKGAVTLVQGLNEITNTAIRPKMPVYNPDHLDVRMKVWELSSNYRYYMPNVYPDATNKPAMPEKDFYKKN